MQDLNHESNTAFGADNYSYEYIHKEWSPRGWTQIIKGHACYDPTKVLMLYTSIAVILSSCAPIWALPPPATISVWKWCRNASGSQV